ncbi:hypothetical protein [Nonomuraea insulae]|uniref:Uncharacterized protein n=1 Tax=Nonomuraea insulae TaxID=1616787 RepID=A0ABW1CY30_9ACTN
MSPLGAAYGRRGGLAGPRVGAEGLMAGLIELRTAGERLVSGHDCSRVQGIKGLVTKAGCSRVGETKGLVTA